MLTNCESEVTNIMRKSKFHTESKLIFIPGIIFLSLLVFAADVLSQEQVVSMRKGNATSFAVDAGNGGSFRQNVYLGNYQTSNQDQHWLEISRGGGFFSYRKRNTNFCLDGNRGGANGQSVYLWECLADNQNQHWRKVSVGNSFRLEKRNAPGFSIDGGVGGAYAQDIYLWSSNSSNPNQRWLFRNEAGSPTDVTPPPPGGGDVLTHNFNNGNLGPFYPCTVKRPNYARVVNGRVETYWTEAGYDGSRTSRGAEFCDAVRGEDRSREMRTFDEGSMGFTVNVDRGHSRTSESALAQVFGFNLARDQFSWAGLLELQNGDLVALHRYCLCNPTRAVLVENFEFGRDHDIVIEFKVSNQNRGWFKVTVDGVVRYNATDIRFGIGEFDSNDVQTNQSYTTFKLGMYNHTDRDYTNNEERIVYYDNVTWFNGKNGFSVVNPR